MVQLLGLCRFSYPSEVGAFNHNHPDLTALRQFLYAPDRLAQRFFFFENLALRSMLAQSDNDFTLLILAGDALPPDARARLTVLAKTLPQARLIFAPEGQNHRDICRSVMLDHRDPSADIVAEFRLDDDDAVATDFTRKTRHHLGQAMGIFAGRNQLCIDYCRGVILAFDGADIRLRAVVERNYTPAQVIVRDRDAGESLLDVNHTQLWRRMPTLHWPNRPMFIRGAHGDNDSALMDRTRNAEDWEPLNSGAGQGLADRFGVDPTAILAGWAALSNKGAGGG